MTRTARTPHHKRIDDVAASLLRVLRHTVERGQVSVEECANVVRVQLARPGGPLHQHPVEARARVFAALDVLAAQMEVPPNARSLHAFATAASEAACAVVKAPRHPGVRLAQKVDSASDLARAAVFAEVANAKDSEDLVRRAVTRALKEKKRRGRVVKVDVAEGDPLRALLDLPAKGGVFLPRNDVRTRLASLAKGSAFGTALQQAARFSEELIRPALGEELWELAQPVGLSNRSESKVVVEVRSSTAAQEVHLRKRELLDRLKRVAGLAHVTHVEIVVVSRTSLPVLGRTTKPRSE